MSGYAHVGNGSNSEVDARNGKSALPSRTDIVSPACQVRKVPIGDIERAEHGPTFDRKALMWGITRSLRTSASK